MSYSSSCTRLFHETTKLLSVNSNEVKSSPKDGQLAHTSEVPHYSVTASETVAEI